MKNPPSIILNKTIAQTYERWINSYYWEFCKDCLYTVDDKYAAYGLDPVRNFPANEPYVKYLWGKAWIKRRISLNKFRQGFLTNLYCVTRKLVFALFIEGSSSYILKRAFNEADVILKTRIMNMYANIPDRLEFRSYDSPELGLITLIIDPSKTSQDGILRVNNILGVDDQSLLFRDIRPLLSKTTLLDSIEPKLILPTPRYTQGQISVERYTKLGKQLPPSNIYALEGSVEKSRGITGSDGTVDEASYTENLTKVYTAISPAVEYLQLISSPRPSEFQRFFHSIKH